MGSDFRARRGLRALFVAATVIERGARRRTRRRAPAPRRRPTSQRAQRGAQWLANQIKANGGFVKNFGVADPRQHRVRGDRDACGRRRQAGIGHWRSATSRTKIGTQLQLGRPGLRRARSRTTSWPSVADNQDPRHFGGTGAAEQPRRPAARHRAHDRARQGLVRRAGPDLRRRVPPGPRARRAQGGERPRERTRASSPGIAWLTQAAVHERPVAGVPGEPDGLVPAGRTRTTFTGPDTNSTALAVQGLAAWGKRPSQATVLQSLDADPVGRRRLPVHRGAEPGVGPELDRARDPGDHRREERTDRRRGGGRERTRRSPRSASYQLGCTQPGLRRVLVPGQHDAPNMFATVQAVPALAGKTLPVARSTGIDDVPLTPC